MKKTDFVLILLLVVIVVIGIFSTKGNVKEDEIEYPVKLAGEVGLNEITYSDYEQMVENNEAFVVVIEREGCYYFKQYMPVLKEYVDEAKIAVKYINTDNLTDEEYSQLSTTNNYLKKNKWGTPTTLFMIGNRVVDSISGYVEKDSIEAFFKDRVEFGGK